MKSLVNGIETDLVKTGLKVQWKDGLGTFSVDGVRHTALAVKDGRSVLVSYLGRQFRIEPVLRGAAGIGGVASGHLKSQMPGQVVDVCVVEGEDVEVGQKIVVLEAMKTQQAFTAPFSGKLTKLNVEKGQQVSEGFLLAVIEAP